MSTKTEEILRISMRRYGANCLTNERIGCSCWVDALAPCNAIQTDCEFTCNPFKPERWHYRKSMLWANQWNIIDRNLKYKIPAVAFSEDTAKRICSQLNKESEA
jgi:hypothetical protein